jgi:ABC-type transporter Mla MlaB component
MNGLLSTKLVVWQVPAALTYATWQTAYTDCLASLSNMHADNITFDWQKCQQVDSSALGFILNLKRSTNQAVLHIHAPVQLIQLAKLYEVDGILGL